MPGKGKGIRVRRGQAEDRPGEPLYTLPEIAEHLKVSETALRTAVQHNPGLLVPWRYAGTGRPRLYRLSDAKKFWKLLFV